MYKILPDPNVGQKVKLLNSPHGWEDKYPAGTIGIIAKIDYEDLDSDNHCCVLVALPPKYTSYMWFQPEELEKVETE